MSERSTLSDAPHLQPIASVGLQPDLIAATEAADASTSPQLQFFLPPGAVHPSKRLVLVLACQRVDDDVGPSSSSSSSASAMAAASAAAERRAAPAPAGMSSRFAAARAQMLAQQRAKMLAKQQAAAATATAATGSDATAEVDGGNALRSGASAPAHVAPAREAPDELIRPPPLRASLWRIDGTEASWRSIWEREVGVELQDVVPQGEIVPRKGQTLESCTACAVEWIDEGRYIALALHVQRTSLGAPAQSRQLLSLLSLEDGRRERLIDLHAFERGAPNSATPSQPTPRQSPARIVGMSWVHAAESVRKTAASPSSSLLSMLEPLPALGPLQQVVPSHLRSLPPHMLQRMLRERAKAQGEEEPRIPSQSPMNDAEGLGLAASCFPRHNHDLVSLGLREARVGVRRAGAESLRVAAAATPKRLGQSIFSGTLLLWDEEGRIHIVLGGGLVLGSFPLLTPDAGMQAILSAHMDHDLSSVRALVGPWRSSGAGRWLTARVPLKEAPLGSDASRATVSRGESLGLLGAVRHLSHLSTLLYHHLDYALLSLAHVRARYASLRSHASKWTREVRSTSLRFAADAAHELLVCLLTGRASEVAESLLLANDALTQGATTKMHDEVAEALSELVARCREQLAPALERCLVVLQDLVACCRWPSRFAPLLPRDGSAEQSTLWLTARLAACLSRVKIIEELAEAERLALGEFYKWFKCETERQEALRRDLQEPRVPPVYDALTVAELLDRGFYCSELDALLMTRTTLQRLGEQEEQAIRAEASMDMSANGLDEGDGSTQGQRAPGQGAQGVVDKLSSSLATSELHTTSGRDGVEGRTGGTKATNALDRAIATLEAEWLEKPSRHVLDPPEADDEVDEAEFRRIYGRGRVFASARRTTDETAFLEATAGEDAGREKGRVSPVAHDDARGIQGALHEALEEGFRRASALMAACLPRFAESVTTEEGKPSSSGAADVVWLGDPPATSRPESLKSGRSGTRESEATRRLTRMVRRQRLAPYADDEGRFGLAYGSIAYLSFWPALADQSQDKTLSHGQAVVSVFGVPSRPEDDVEESAVDADQHMDVLQPDGRYSQQASRNQGHRMLRGGLHALVPASMGEVLDISFASAHELLLLLRGSRQRGGSSGPALGNASASGGTPVDEEERWLWRVDVARMGRTPQNADPPRQSETGAGVPPDASQLPSLEDATTWRRRVHPAVSTAMPATGAAKTGTSSMAGAQGCAQLAVAPDGDACVTVSAKGMASWTIS